MHKGDGREMRVRIVSAGALAALCLLPALSLAAGPLIAASETSKKEMVVTNRASGTFEVKLSPLDMDEPTLGRMSIAKQFHGDLDGVSKGQMLTAGTEVKGSAAYVAVERITGTLGGRSGSFVLQHYASLNRGVPQQGIAVVPDSGTGQLQGLAGTMTIRIVDGRHFYDFDYTLAPAP